ncbi:MAG TPA: polyprenyl synthetase family protein [Opitutaceae bacterium]|nr:polyprenyl synthetase family protein [Opitutaceae bacterium]
MSTASFAEPTRTGPSAHAFASMFGRLQPHMAELDRFLRAQVTAFEPEVRQMADYCIDTSGKRIRPALVFFSGWRDSSTVSPELVRMAAVVELVHLATLVHDDIMDDAAVRRGRKTAARAYGPVAAVLLGDTLFSHALHLASQFSTTDVCLAISDSTRRVCAGEIIQTLRRGSTEVTLEDYHRVIDLKTAELFRVSCQLGSQLGGYPAAFSEAAGRFGRHLGIAYQIYDDLADYFGEEKRIGKTLGTDLASGKLTLPLLVLLERLGPAERTVLLEEIAGSRPPQLSLHLREMAAHDVFPAVAEAVQREVAEAAAALAPWPQLAASPLLLSLCDVLRGQVTALRAPPEA